MIKLNLKAENAEHEVLKEYLQENVSTALAEKIQNGVKIVKDGKTLINKKDLAGFMKYACEEARKLAIKGATGACVKDEIVFGWLIHYFEEDSIEGKLCNEDGSEYKPTPKPVQRVPAPSVSVKSTPLKPAQASLFDFLASTPPISEPMEENIEKPVEEVKNPISEDIDEDDDDPTDWEVDEETGEILSRKPTVKHKPTSLYQRYSEIEKQYPQAVVAYRLGDFFEVLGDNAIRIANRLELTLTGRDCGLPERIPMVGFPYHASDTYFRKIAEFAPLIVVEDDKATPFVLAEKTTINTPAIKAKEPTMYENNDEEDDFEEERALQKFFDKDALCTLYELFDYNLDIQ